MDEIQKQNSPEENLQLSQSEITLSTQAKIIKGVYIKLCLMQ